jgi:hypothetical protein
MIAGADLCGQGITPVTHSRTIVAKGYLLPTNYGVFVTKPTYNVLTEANPSHFIFNSDYGTLKYNTSGSLQLEIDVLDAGIAASVTYNHALGYIPYIEVYVQVPTGEWEYVPSYGYGASTWWYVTYKITTTDIVFYAEEMGFEEENPVFNLKFFVFKNELKFT